MNARNGEHLGTCAWRAAGMSDCLQQVEVVHVVAHVAHFIHADSQFLTNLLHRLAFGHRRLLYRFGCGGHVAITRCFLNLAPHAGVEVGEAQFACAVDHDRQFLRSDDSAGNTRLLQQCHAHAVIHAETLEFVAIGGVIQPAVGKATVHVREKESNWLHWLYTV